MNMAGKENMRLEKGITEAPMIGEAASNGHTVSPVLAMKPEDGIVDIEVGSSHPPVPRREKPSRPRGPSKMQLMNQMYNMPAPIRTFPLPFFSPSNPLSLLQIAYTWLQQVISPPSSHPTTLYQGWYSPETQSVHVADPKSIRALWERGFFGKGTLSRSEPSWLDREKRRRGERASQTSEEVTRKRRAERQQVKWERARKEREAIEETLLQERSATMDASSPRSLATVPVRTHMAPVGPQEILALPNSSTDLDAMVQELHGKSEGDDEGYGSAPTDIAPNGFDKVAPNEADRNSGFDTTTADGVTGDTEGKRATSAKSVRFSPTVEQSTFKPDQPPSPELAAIVNENFEEPELAIEDQEHLQLTLEEAFFLNFGFGVLDVIDPFTRQPLTSQDLLAVCRLSSEFGSGPQISMPDDMFMLSYVVYHHFRSLGWVVRSGIKFGVDYLLYNRGPPFSHAEFAITILPAYSHPDWSQSAEVRAHVTRKTSRTWSWLHCINRVNTQVKKTLVLVYVDVPPPTDHVVGHGLTITEMLARYKVREVVLKRWSANRNRD